MKAPTKPRTPPEARIVLYGILAFFLVVVGVNAVFITMAIRTFPGEETERSYLQGLHFNETLEDRARQAELGWSAIASFEGQPSDSASLVVLLRGADGAPLSALSVSGRLRRPGTTKQDRVLSFRPDGAEGRYVADLGRLNPGRWQFEARAQASGGRHFDFSGERTWPST